MNSTMTRRNLLKLAAASSLLTVGACSKDDGGGAATIKFSWWGNPERHEVTKRALAQFAKESPDIRVTPVFGGYTNYHEKLLTSAAGGQAPDLMQVQQSFLSEFAHRGVVTDLNQYKDILKLSALDQASLKSATFDGKLNALSFGDSAIGVFLDVTAIQQARLKVPEHDWTWDEFGDFCGRLSRAIGGDYRGTDDFATNAWALEVWTRQRQNGVGVFAGDKLGIRRETLTAWFEFWQNLRKDKAVVTPQVAAESTGDNTSPLIRGKAATLTNYALLLKPLSQLTKHNLTIVAMPAGEAAEPADQQWVTGSSWLTIAARSKHAEAAATLAGALLNDVETGRILKFDRGIPPNPEVRAAVSKDADPLEKATLDYVEYVRKHSSNLAYQIPAASTAVTSALGRASQDLAFGRRSVSEAVDVFMAEADKALQS